MRRRLCGLFLVLFTLACGGDSVAPDAGPHDAGPAESGAPDLGVDAPCSTDADADGHRAMACGGDDCDDADPLRYPGRTEVCDDAGHDDDCDPATLGPDA